MNRSENLGYHIMEGTVNELLRMVENKEISEQVYEEGRKYAAKLLNKLPGDRWHTALPEAGNEKINLNNKQKEEIIFAMMDGTVNELFSSLENKDITTEYCDKALKYASSFFKRLPGKVWHTGLPGGR